METTLQGLNLTVAGMGLVFFALAILMVAVVGLDRLFPGEAPRPTKEPDVVPAVPPPAAPPGYRLQAILGERTFLVEEKAPDGKTHTFVLDGREFKVERSRAATGELIIDGEPYRVDLVGMVGDVARLSVAGQVVEVKLAEAPAAPTPAPAPAAVVPAAAPAAPAAAPAGGRPFPAPLPGKILRVAVAVGAAVTAEQELCVIEAMKMENSIKAPAAGVVTQVLVQPGQSVLPGETLMLIQ